NVYPTAVGAALGEIAGLTGEYVCRVSRTGARDEMTVLVETTADRMSHAEVAKHIAQTLRRRLGVELAVEVVAPGAPAPLTGIEASQKPVRLIDTRSERS